MAVAEPLTSLRRRVVTRTISARFFATSLGLLFGGVTAVSAPAFAQAQPPASAAGSYPQCTKAVDPEESKTAHTRYIAGKQDYDEGNYESAIRRFRDAYALDCTKHELLIIISAAYEKRGDKKESVGALEAYVSRAPNAPDVSTYQTKIERLKKEIAAAPPPPTASAAPTSAPPPGAATEQREHTPYPWIAVGVGATAVAVGIVLLATSPDLPPNCGTTGGENSCKPVPGSDLAKDQAEAERSVNQPVAGIITLSAGAAVMIAGVVWHFLEPTGPKDKVAVRPTWAPGYAGLSLGGRF